MKISDILKQNNITVSCEVFPPKQFALLNDAVRVVEETSKLNPSFISCTYGASGGTSDYTVEIAKQINKCGIPALAHLTCVSSTKEKVSEVIKSLSESGIENILALRGDIPTDKSIPLPKQYRYASELISEIKQHGGFCIGGACYPEGHPESISPEADIVALKIKTEMGAEFLTTQMFFDNDIYFRFREKCAKAEITVPILAGIMPVTNAARIEKMLYLSKSKLSKELSALLEKYGGTPDMEKAGIEYAISQINGIISHGFGNIHIYTMNRPNIAKAIIDGIER